MQPGRTEKNLFGHLHEGCGVGVPARPRGAPGPDSSILHPLLAASGVSGFGSELSMGRGSLNICAVKEIII